MCGQALDWESTDLFLDGLHPSADGANAVLTCLKPLVAKLLAASFAEDPPPIIPPVSI